MSRIYREASTNECEDMCFEHLGWDIENERLVTDDIDSLSAECTQIGAKLTITDGEIQILVPIMEDDSLVNDADLDTSDLENKKKVEDLDALYELMKEEISKKMEEIGNKLRESVEDIVNKNKLVTEDTLTLFAERLKEELNSRFDEIKRSIP